MNTKNYFFRTAVFIIFINILFIYQGIAGQDKNPGTEKIRESVLAGTWYPEDEKTLRKSIRDFLNNVPERPVPGKLVGLIAPHAGYIYSGQVAAHSYKILEKQKFDSVIVIAPSHYARFEGVSVYDRGGYRTPLGLVPLDHNLISALKKKEKHIRYVPEAHFKEHSLEIQLPFIQHIMPGFKLVPLVMGDQSLDTCVWMARTLASVIQNKSVLIIASSDLSHFHSYQQAKILDKTVQDKVRNFDPEGLNKSLEAGECEACGKGPVITALTASRILGANKSEVLHYANSGDVTGDHKRVVGYMAAALWNTPGKHKKTSENHSDKTGIDMGLTNEEKDFLHKIVKETIQAKLSGEKLPEYENSFPKLKEPRGAFVTLKKHGKLRGCIGHIIARYPLINTISKMAVSAAFEDPRFPPVRQEEFKDIDIEISVLTPLRKIKDVNEIQVGTHGIYIKKGYFSGLLLPQVATEYGWNRDTFLEHTCLKAGLPRDTWKEQGVEIYIFSADIF
ncbi:MAG: AmmeMemoRadiSam system protein B [Desulfobacteraceae bacterium]|nr:AmmeMemoRadiSam system protein B [Desulfobacteraceae bacterium]